MLDPKEERALLELFAGRADQRAPVDIYDSAGEAALQRLVDGHCLVFAVWDKPESEFGLGSLIIKGEGELDVAIHTGILKNLSWTAIRCHSGLEALAIKTSLGDGSKLV